MKREQFLKRVAEMCGPVESEAIHRLAAMPHNRRHAAARDIALEADDQGLADFLISLIDDDFIDDLTAILPRPERFDEAQKLLSRLWTRLLTMISPEARDVLYAHNQLRLMMDVKTRRTSTEEVPAPQSAYQTALENARAVLAAADGGEDEEAPRRSASFTFRCSRVPGARTHGRLTTMGSSLIIAGSSVPAPSTRRW